MAATGRQPDQRAYVALWVERLEAASDVVGGFDWNDWDTLSWDQIKMAVAVMAKVLGTTSKAYPDLARAWGKRSGQSVSGRFSTYVPAGHKRRRNEIELSRVAEDVGVPVDVVQRVLTFVEVRTLYPDQEVR